MRVWVGAWWNVYRAIDLGIGKAKGDTAGRVCVMTAVGKGVRRGREKQQEQKQPANTQDRRSIDRLTLLRLTLKEEGALVAG